MRIVIIEDEDKQVESVKSIISQANKDWIVIGSSGSVLDGISLIKKTQPDLAILDVMIMGGTSFDIIDKLKNIDFEIIFTTSYDEFAIKAFKVSAVNYLLKPFSDEELLNALHQAQKRIVTKQTSEKIRVLKSYLKTQNPSTKKIPLPTIKGIHLVEPRSILYCKSENTYTSFVLENGKKVMISKTLKAVEEILENLPFVRVHNRILVNIIHVVEYKKGEGGQIILSNNEHINVSRRRKESFLNSLGLGR